MIGNKELLLMVNVLVGQKLVVEPQDSVLGPILFVIFINDIEDGICGNIFKFADDTTLFCTVGSDINCAKLRADLRKLYNWSEDCQMLFNLVKCIIMHFGYNNPNNIFY